MTTSKDVMPEGTKKNYRGPILLRILGERKLRDLTKKYDESRLKVGGIKEAPTETQHEIASFARLNGYPSAQAKFNINRASVDYAVRRISMHEYMSNQYSR